MDKKTIFLFCGENTFLLAGEIKRWRNEFEKKYGGEMNITVLEEKESLTGNEIQTAMESAAFLADKRLVIVKNFLKNGEAEDQEKVAKFIEKIPESTIAVFFEEALPDRRTKLFRKLKEIAEIKEFSLLSEGQILAWIKKQALANNIRLSPGVEKTLLQQAGPDLWILDSELKKLSAFCKNRAVTPEDVKIMTRPNLSTSIFTLTDSISEKRTDGAIDLFHILMESGEEIRGVFAMLIRHFRILLLLADLIAHGTKKTDLFREMKKYDAKFHPYAISQAIKQVQNFSLEKLKKIYEKLAEIDLQMKIGEIKEETGDKREIFLAIEKFIIECTI